MGLRTKMTSPTLGETDTETRAWERTPSTLAPLVTASGGMEVRQSTLRKVESIETPAAEMVSEAKEGEGMDEEKGKDSKVSPAASTPKARPHPQYRLTMVSGHDGKKEVHVRRHTVRARCTGHGRRGVAAADDVRARLRQDIRRRLLALEASDA